MAGTRTPTLDWRLLNKTKLTILIRDIVNPIPMGAEFASDVLSDLIAERHYYCSTAGLRPERFRKIADRPPYTFQGLFPGLGWRAVSWSKCVNGFSFRAELKKALRRLIELDVVNHRTRNPTCARCGAVATEVDHADPEFDVMAEDALSLLDADMERKLLAAHDWLSDEEWQFPSGSPVMLRMLELHRTAVLMSVCHPCHLENARERKGKVR